MADITSATLLLPGDLLLYNGRGLLPSLIGWAETGKGEAPTYAKHVGGIGHSGPLPSATRIEALWKVEEFPATGLVNRRVQVWRMDGLTYGERTDLAAYARKHLGDKYGVLKLGAHLGDALLSKAFGGHPYVFRKLARLDDYPICSWLWAYAYDRVLGYRFGMPPRAAAPDDILDWIEDRPEWFMVAESKGVTPEVKL